MAPMTLARLALLVATYIALDVANPLMPGALTFGVESSVEVRQAERFRGQAPHVAVVPRLPEPAQLDVADRSRPSLPPAPTATYGPRLTHVTRSHLPVPAAAGSEDH
jgi:hypothetical protein